jgi:hypothetical protein
MLKVLNRRLLWTQPTSIMLARIKLDMLTSDLYIFEGYIGSRIKLDMLTSDLYIFEGYIGSRIKLDMLMSGLYIF